MATGGVLVLCFACLGAFAGARADKMDIYARVVDLVAPGEEFLTEDALVSVFERLENRVQCSGVSCGKVGYIYLRSFGEVEVQRAPAAAEGSCATAERTNLTEETSPIWAKITYIRLNSALYREFFFAE